MESEDSEVYLNPYKWDCYSLGKTLVGLVDINAVKSDELMDEAMNEISYNFPSLHVILKKLLDPIPENRPTLDEVLSMIGEVKIDKLVTKEEFDFVVEKIRMKNVKGDIEDSKKLASFYLKVADFKNAKAYLESLLSKYEDDEE